MLGLLNVFSPIFIAISLTSVSARIRIAAEWIKEWRTAEPWQTYYVNAGYYKYYHCKYTISTVTTTLLNRTIVNDDSLSVNIT